MHLEGGVSDVLKQIGESYEELLELRERVREVTGRAGELEVALERATARAEKAEKALKLRGVKDGLPRGDEAWLFRNEVTVQWSLPPSGRRRVKLRALGVGRPIVQEFDGNELTDHRCLRETVKQARGRIHAARG